MSFDLDTMALKDLKDLRKSVDKAITSFEDRKKREALAKLEETAKTLGFDLAELTGGAKTRKKRGKVAPKYANPADKSQTWTGRGRKPLWVVAALKAGKRLDDLAI